MCSWPSVYMYVCIYIYIYIQPREAIAATEEAVKKAPENGKGGVMVIIITIIVIIQLMILVIDNDNNKTIGVSYKGGGLLRKAKPLSRNCG